MCIHSYLAQDQCFFLVLFVLNIDPEKTQAFELDLPKMLLDWISYNAPHLISHQSAAPVTTEKFKMTK